MKKQIIRIAALALFVTTFAVATAHAQNKAVVTVTIPFDFNAGGKTLPAGDYQVREENSRTAMKIQSGDGDKGAYFMIHPAHHRDIQNVSKVVFQKYGNEYFLSQVWIAGSSNGEELNTKSRERALQREIAKRGGKSESVAIIARAN